MCFAMAKDQENTEFALIQVKMFHSVVEKFHTIFALTTRAIYFNELIRILLFWKSKCTACNMAGKKPMRLTGTWVTNFVFQFWHKEVWKIVLNKKHKLESQIFVFFFGKKSTKIWQNGNSFWKQKCRCFGSKHIWKWTIAIFQCALTRLHNLHFSNVTSAFQVFCFLCQINCQFLEKTWKCTKRHWIQFVLKSTLLKNKKQFVFHDSSQHFQIMAFLICNNACMKLFWELQMWNAKHNLHGCQRTIGKMKIECDQPVKIPFQHVQKVHTLLLGKNGMNSSDCSNIWTTIRWLNH